MVTCFLLDTILDLFNDEEARTAVLSYYQDTNEPTAIRNAILESRKSKKNEFKPQGYVVCILSLNNVYVTINSFC